MYKLISYFRAVSDYPADARIVQITPREYALYIKHDIVGVVRYRRGCVADLEKELFFFIPYGYTRPILWKKVQINGDLLPL